MRYIDWFITTPLLLLDLALTAALPWPTILFLILTDEVMIVTGLVGALVKSSYKVSIRNFLACFEPSPTSHPLSQHFSFSFKFLVLIPCQWGYFAFGCAALCYVLYILTWEGRKHANALGQDVGKVFLYCGALTSILWTLYPIAWGVCEGGNIIAPDSEAVFYGILDLFAKPVFGALLIWGHKDVAPERLGLYIHDYSEKDPSAAAEKKIAPGVAGTALNEGHANGNTNGQTNNNTNGNTAESV